MKKKIVSIIVAVAMIMALLPANVFAKEETGYQKIAGSLCMNEKGEKVFVFDEDDIYEGLQLVKNELLEDIKYYEETYEEYKDEYSESVKEYVSAAIKEYKAIIENAKTFEELGIKLHYIKSNDYENIVVYDIEEESVILNKTEIIIELLTYWPSAYCEDITDIENVRGLVKSSVEMYFNIKMGSFNDYYASAIKGAKEKYLKSISEAESVSNLIIIRFESRLYAAWSIGDSVESFTEPQAGISDDDDYYDDYDDEGDTDTLYDSDMAEYEYTEMTQDNIEEIFKKDASEWTYYYTWNAAPESIKVNQNVIYVSWSEFITEQEMSDAKVAANKIIESYIEKELAGFEGDLDAIKEIAQKYKNLIDEDLTIDNIVYDCASCIEEMQDISGIEIKTKTSTEVGKEIKALEELYDEYFKEGLYSFNGYKELYRIYGYCYSNICEDLNTNDFPEGFISNAKELMEEIPTLIEETREKYINKLNKYIGNSKYNQKKVKAVVKEATKAINASDDAEEIVSIYKEYKAKADKTVKTFKITVSKSGKGKVSASKTVKYGNSYTVKIKASKGYEIKSVTVDGKKIKKAKKTGSYTFKNVKKNHKIKVVFKKK